MLTVIVSLLALLQLGGPDLVAHADTDSQSLESAHQAITKFVNHKLRTAQGIKTNVNAGVNAGGGTANGNELLSESAGLYLQHLVLTNQKASFIKFYQQTKQTFYSHGQFSYRYNPKTQQRAGVNATLDDLRIIGALQQFDHIFKTTRYQKEIKTLWHHQQKQALKKGHVTDFYDPKTKKRPQTGTLSYFDLATLRALEGNTKIYRQQVRIVQRGFISKAMPFYARRYNYHTHKYTAGNINTTEGLVTLLHVAQIGRLKPASERWLLKQTKAKTLVNQYDQHGKALTEDQSAANYALVMMIGNASGQKGLQQAAQQQLLAMQVTNTASPLAGGFGDETTNTAYSFNNLTALVAMDGVTH
ncbi:MAG TPA: glycosyl hydrolase family 8 [Lactobacillus sp.]|nr:glycosyl hydrolase family 8 [Lactobacillus sp.]